jgi:hypothetical protein
MPFRKAYYAIDEMENFERFLTLAQRCNQACFRLPRERWPGVQYKFFLWTLRQLKSVYGR